MFTIGCHLSIARGFRKMGQQALSVGAQTMQFFSRNPRGLASKTLDPQDAADFLALMEDHAMGPLLCHGPYTLNCCSTKAPVRELAQRIMSEDLAKMERFFPGNMYNFHPGSHGGQGVEQGIVQIQEALNNLLPLAETTTVLLETMAGQGTELGRSFQELRAIMDGVNLPERLGVCLDSCHLFAAGYDIAGGLDGVLDQFDQVISLSKLKAIHLNDSLSALGSHRDRHAKIGQGQLGLEALVKLVCHPLLRDLPFYLETPNELSGYSQEMELLRRCREERLGPGV